MVTSAPTVKIVVGSSPVISLDAKALVVGSWQSGSKCLLEEAYALDAFLALPRQCFVLDHLCLVGMI